MKRFSDLVQAMVLTKDTDDFSAPARQQREAAEKFPSMLPETGLYTWNPNHIPEPFEKRLVIGVATWSRPDMQLLDELALWAMPMDRCGVRIEIFNVYGFESLNSFEERIPGLGMVYHTPVAGIWEQGEWKQRASGYAARLLISDYVRRKTEESLARLLSPEVPEGTAPIPHG